MSKILYVILHCLIIIISKSYLFAPGLSWDAMLKVTKMELELISDPGLYIFFEKDIIGGISYIFNRYSKANSKYLKSYHAN